MTWYAIAYAGMLGAFGLYSAYDDIRDRVAAGLYTATDGAGCTATVLASASA